MTIVVSACLMGENCKYSGGNNYSEKLSEFVKGHTVITVCPEMLGGLPVPRPAAEIVKGTVMNKAGENVDREFRIGAERALKIARREKAELIILQSRSPSCGVKQIYDGSFSGTKIPGRGVFAGMAIDAGFRVIDIEDI